MAADIGTSRREFVAAMGAGVAAGAAIATSTESAAQNAAPTKIIDFHNHYMGPSLTLTNLASVPPAARPTWEKINANLQSPGALLASVESAGITARVINTPTAFIEDADGKVPRDAERRINDAMAEICAKHPGKLYGLATVDAFAGDQSARELTRAVKDLGLRGVFVESAKGDLLLGAKESRPTLAAASALGVPVFVHPQTDPELHKRFSRTGRIGVRLARGTVNSAALINMLESGAFDEIPKLQLVVTTLAFGGVLLAGGFGLALGALLVYASLEASPKPYTPSTLAQGTVSLGPESAPVTVEEFGDYQCPICRQFELGAGAQLKANEIAQGKVRYVGDHVVMVVAETPPLGTVIPEPEVGMVTPANSAAMFVRGVTLKLLPALADGIMAKRGVVASRATFTLEPSS